jgi:16S rRNA (guanine966-N2)-methyltransferase
MRVIGGEFRGRKLRVPRGDATRPTSDRVRESLFNVLGHRVEGARFLDAFAGTGAVGIEALSRGASRVTFVENAKNALAVLDANLNLVQVEGRIRVMAREFVNAVVSMGAEIPFDLIYLDPPYAPGELLRALRLASADGFLAPDGWLVAEHEKWLILPEAEGKLRKVRSLIYGRTTLSIFMVS